MTRPWTNSLKPRSSRHRAGYACCLLLAAAFGACTPLPTPCTGNDRCPQGYECLANRCVVQGAEPVREASQRGLSRIVDLAVISERVDYAGTVPGGVSLGAQRTGTLELLLRFEPVWRQYQEIEQAFLLLERLPGSRAVASQVDVTVWRIEQAWGKDELSWHSQPELAHPRARGIASSNGSPLRVDVTKLVRYLKQHPHRDHGIALRADAVGGAGVSYATGAGGGSAPRIEIYAR